jgi:biopolymer transport protein TolQ
VFEKLAQFRKAKSAAERFEGVFWSGTSLDELYRGLAAQQNTSTPAVFVAAMREWKRSADQGPRIGGLQLRLQKVMDVAISRELEKLESKLLVLATVGSISPFVGLFGTVWGIMTAFQGIAMSKNTSLAVVAPGIAEALFATALGLIAAIPAVAAYNKFATDLGRHQGRLEGFADEFGAILSRQIDQRS